MAVSPYPADPKIGLEPTQDYAPSPSDTRPGSPEPTTPPVSAPLSILGQCVGQYRVAKELGRGGMGVVYLAEHGEIGQRAALKTLHPEISGNPQFKRRFLNELRRPNAWWKNC